MKKIALIIALLVAYSVSLYSQSGTVKPYKMYNSMKVKPKRGQEKKFETAVKDHIVKFHANAPYSARLSVITEGSGSDGWYIWVMGPLTYTDLDNMPQGKKDHDDDWEKTVDIYVEQYGESNFWKLQEDLSVTPPNYNPDRLDVWMIDIKTGMRYQFSDLMKKWKAMWEAKKYPYSMRVAYNDLWSGSGNDAVIIYSFDKYADFDLDINWRKDYESMYGDGSWDNFWKEWNQCVLSVDEQLRKVIK